MKTRILSTARLSFPLATALAAMLFAPSAFAGNTWDGGGGDDNWSTNANWNSDTAPTLTTALTFAGSVRLTPINNLTADTSVAGFSFTNTATNAFTISGNRITLGGGITTTAATSGSLTDTISLDMILSAGRTVTTNANHHLEIGGNITQSAASGITKAGAGTLTLSGNNTYAGATTISAGVLIHNSANAIPGGIASGGSGTQISINGGILGLAHADFTRGVTATTGTAGTIRFNSNGGFAAYGADRTVNFGGAGGFVAIGSGVAAGTIGSLNGKNLFLGAADATHKLIFANGIDVGGADRTVQVNNGAAAVDAEFSGVIRAGTSGFGLTKTGTGTLLLSALNTFNGALTINAGTLVAGLTGNGTSSSLGSIVSTRTINVNSGSTLRVDIPNVFHPTFSAPATSLPTISINASTMTNGGTATNSALGNITLAGGILTATTGSPIGTGQSGEGWGSWNLNGTVTSTGNSTISSTAPGDIPMTLSATADNGYITTFDVQSGTLTASAPFGNVTRIGNETVSGLSKTGAGAMLITGTNTYTGATSLTDGTLTLSGSGAINSSSGITINGSGAKLLQTSSVAVSPTVTLTQGTLTGSGTVNTVNVGDATGGTVSNNDGVAGAALTIGALTFNGGATVNTFSNSTSAPIVTNSLATNSAGTVTINASAASWPAGTYDLISYGGGSIGVGGFDQFVLGTVTGTGARQTKALGNSGSAVTLVVGADDPLYWAGDGDGKWNLASINNWKLTSDNSYTTFLVMDNVLFNDSATGAGAINVDIDVADVSPNSTIFNNITKDYVLGSTGGFGIASGTLTKNGSAAVTLSNANTYPGGTTLNAGTLVLGNTGAIGTGPLAITGGNLDSSVADLVNAGNNAQTWNGDFTFLGSQNLNLGTGAVTMSANRAVTVTANNLTVGGAIGGGAVGLAKLGDGTLTLSGANGYSGATTVGSGVLRLGNAAALGAGTGTPDGTTVASGATLDLGGVSNGANSAAGSERITVSGSGVGAGGAIISSSAIASPFIGVRYLTLTGDTTLGFSNRWDIGSSTAANNAFVGGGYDLTFLGTTPAAQASLNFLGETDLGDINVNLGSDTATNILYLQGDTTLGQPGKTVTISGGATLAWWTNVTPTTYDKKFALDNGLLNFNKSNTTFTLPGTISLTNSNTVTSNVSTTSVIASNEISGSGSLTKSGPGTLTLAGANIYSGLTTVDGGVLRITDAGALGGTTNGVVVNGTNSGAASNARLELSGGITVTGESATIKGNGNFLGALQSLSGSNEWAGNIMIDADLTRIGAASGASLLVSGVIDDGASDYRLMYRVSDAAASVTLTGANTYSGISSIVGAGPVIVGSLNSVVGGAASSHLGAPVTAENGKIIIGTTTVIGTLRYVGSGETTDRTVQVGENSTAPVVGDTGGAVIESEATTTALGFSAPVFNIPTNAETGTSPARTLTLGGGNINANTISGIIQNNQIAGNPTALVNVTKTGAGSWTLSGANTYTGTTTIDQGTLVFNTVNQSLSGGLTFGSANGSTNNGTLDLSGASATFAGAALVRNNSVTPNAINIGAAQQLTLNGNLTLGYDAAGGTGQTDSMLTATGLGSMAVNGTTINISVNQAAVNAGYWSKGTLDVSGLAAFSTNVTNFNIGVGSTTHGPGDVLLSDTANTILATTLQVGVTGGNNGRGTSTLTLGTGTNVIQADTINIGRNKSSGPGVVKFASQTAGSPGTVTIANKLGTGRANIDIANMVSTASGGGAIGNLDLRGHTATVSAGTVTMGNTAAGSNSGSTNGTLSFDDGTFDVNTLNMAPKSGGGTGTARATLNIGGGTFTVNTAFTMGSQSGSGASVATVNLTGGTLSSSAPILKGAGTTTSTINLSGGTLDLNGNAIGSGSAAITLKAESGTLSNIASINGTGGLTKTTAGTLLLSGTITYAGDTTVSEGTLTLSNATDPLNANTANDASTVTIAATGATLDLTYTGTDKVDKLFIGASQLAAGVYGKSGSVSPIIGIPQITGDGTLTVASGTTYASWINGFFPGETDPAIIGPAADPDFDGIENGVEMVIGGNPKLGMDSALLPTIELVNADPDGDTTFADYLLFTYRRTDLSAAAGVTADCETDTDLVAPWTAATGAPGVVIQVDNNFTFTPPAAADTDRVRVYVPRGANTTLFGRLKVVVP